MIEDGDGWWRKKGWREGRGRSAVFIEALVGTNRNSNEEELPKYSLLSEWI